MARFRPDRAFYVKITADLSDTPIFQHGALRYSLAAPFPTWLPVHSTSLHLPSLATRPRHASFNMATTARWYCRALDCVILPTCCTAVSTILQSWTRLRHLLLAAVALTLAQILQTGCIISSLVSHTKRVCLTSSLFCSYQQLCSPIYTAIPNSTGPNVYTYLLQLKYIQSPLHLASE
jgi:hypothetical protein